MVSFEIVHPENKFECDFKGNFICHKCFYSETIRRSFVSAVATGMGATQVADVSDYSVIGIAVAICSISDISNEHMADFYLAVRVDAIR